MVAGPGRNLASRCAAGDAAGHQVAEQHARMKVGDHRARRLEALAVLEHDGCRRAGFGDDLAHRRVDPHLAAGGGDRRGEHGGEIVGAAAADRHAESLVGHGFQIGKQCAAGAVGREIKMHAPASPACS